MAGFAPAFSPSSPGGFLAQPATGSGSNSGIVPPIQFAPPSAFAKFVPPVPVQAGAFVGPTGSLTAYPSVLPPNYPAQQPATHGVGGFFTNAERDLRGMVTGISTLLSAGMHDAVKLGGEALSLGQAHNFMGSYELPSMVRAMPEALKQDYLSRYGSWSGFVHGLYEHPLEFLSDVSAVATLGGSTLGTAAALAGKAAEGGELAGQIGAVASKLAPIEERVGMGTASAQDAVDLAKFRGQLADLQSRLPLITQRFLPGFGTPSPGGVRWAAAGGAFRPVNLVTNPWTRFVRSQVTNALSVPLGKVEDAMQGLGNATELTKAQALVNRAHLLGAERVDRLFVQNHTMRDMLAKIVGQAKGGAIAERSAQQAELQRIYANVPKDQMATGIFAHNGLDAPALADVAGDPTKAGVWEQAANALGESAAATAAARAAQEFDPLSVHLGYRPADVHVPGEMDPTAPPATPTEQVALRDVPKDQRGPYLSSAADQMRDVLRAAVGAEQVAEPIMDKGLPVLRVTMPSFADAEATVAKVRQALGDVSGIDNLIANPRKWMNRAVHLTVARPSDGLLARVELHTPTSLRAAQVADEAWQHISDTVSALAALQLKVQRDGPGGNDLAKLAELQRQVEMGTAYHASLFEPVVSELRQAAGEELRPIDLARENARLFVAEHWEREMMHGQQIAPWQLLDRMYRPLRIASGAKFDYAARDFTGGADVLDLHYARMREGNYTPMYVHEADLRRVRPSGFMVTGGEKLVGMRTPRQQAYERTDTGYLLRNGQVVKDPMEALMRRSAASIRMQEHWDLAQRILNAFARPIGDDDFVGKALVLPDSERLFAPDGLTRAFAMRQYLDDAIGDAIQNSRSMDSGVREALANLMPQVQGELVRTIKGFTRNGVPIYAIPKVVADNLTRHLSIPLGVRTRLFWDGPLNLWRSLTLMGSPRWAANVFLGNIVFLKGQGGRMSDVIRQLSPGFRKMLDTAIPEDALREMQSSSFLGGAVENYTARLGEAGNTTVGRFYRALQSNRPARFVHNIANHYGNFMAGIEMAYRKASYLAAAEDIDRAALGRIGKTFWTSQKALQDVQRFGANARNVDRAMGLVYKYMGEYDRLGAIEKNVVRRFFVPFYGFYKHTAKALVTLPFDQPLRFDVMRMLGNLGQDISQAYGPLPPWLLGTVPFEPGFTPGTTRFFNTGGINPFMMLFQSPLTGLAPQWRAILEEIQGQNLEGRPFTAPDVISPEGSGNRLYHVNAQGQVELVQAVRPSMLELFLRTIPQYQLIEDLKAGAATYDTATLWDMFMNPRSAVITNPLTLQPQYPESLAQRIGSFLGVSTVDYGLADFQQGMLQDRANALLTYLRTFGYLPPAGVGQVQVPIYGPFGQPA